MDSETQKLERQKALEEKRMKLEKLKREREERAQQAAAAAAASSKNDANDKENKSNSRAEVDDLVNTLLSNGSGSGNENSSTSETSKVEIPATSNTQQNLSSQDCLPRISLEDKLSRLTVNKAVVHVDIAPTLIESYEKGTQTDANESEDPDCDTSLDGINVSPVKGSHRRLRLSTGSTSNDHHRFNERNP